LWKRKVGLQEERKMGSDFDNMMVELHTKAKLQAYAEAEAELIQKKDWKSLQKLQEMKKGDIKE